MLLKDRLQQAEAGAFVVFTMDNDESEEHLADLAEICDRLEGFRPRRGGNARTRF